MSDIGFDAQQQGKGKKKIVQNERYYIEAEFAVFEVEKRLFKVPTHMFKKESPRFSEIFGLVLPNDIEVDGKATHDQNVSNVIILKDVREEDFGSLLKILYPLDISSGISLSKEEWISVLYISTEWTFLRVRQMAIAELDHLMLLTPVEKVVLGRDIPVSGWVRSGLEEIVDRKQPISDHEGIELDSDDDVITALKLSEIREERIRGKLFPFTSMPKIEESFGGELSRLMIKENNYRGEEFLEKQRKVAKELERLEKYRGEEEEKMRVRKQEEAKMRRKEKMMKKEAERLLIEEKERMKKGEYEKSAEQLNQLLSKSRVFGFRAVVG